MVLTGKLYFDEMRQVLDDFVEKSKGIKEGAMLCDVLNYQLPSLGAIVIEFSQMPRLLRVTGQFRKMAVLTDES